jgi:hypothetical protein
VRAPQRLHACFGKTKVFHFALLDQIFDNARDVFDRHIWIDAMLVEQVDAICLQSFERSLGNFPDVLRAAINADLLSSLGNLEPELRRDNHLIANGRQRFANHVLVGEWTIDLRRVKKRDAAFDCRSN